MEQRRRKVILWGTIGLLVLLAVSSLWLLVQRQPTYKGKTMRYWLEVGAGTVSINPASPAWVSTLATRQQEVEDAGEALRVIGTNSLPWITPLLKARDSKVMLELQKWAQKRSPIKFHFTTAERKHQEALWAFEGMGPFAESALPDLARILRDPDSAKDAATAIARVGPPAIPILIDASTNPEVRVRMAALEGLRELSSRWQYILGTNDASVLPAAIHLALHDPVLEVRAEALSIVPLFKPYLQPGLVVPALVACAHDQNGLHENATMVLRELRILRPVEAVPLFLRGLQDSDEDVRNASAATLLKFGKYTDSWIPESQAALLRRVIPTLLGTVTNQDQLGEAEWVRLLPDWPETDSACLLILEMIPRTAGLPRAMAVTALGEIHTRADLAVPALIRELRIGNVGSKRAAAAALVQFGSEAKVAVPVILELLTKPKGSGSGSTLDPGLESETFAVNRSLKLALLQIDPHAAAKAGIK